VNRREELTPFLLSTFSYPLTVSSWTKKPAEAIGGFVFGFPLETVLTHSSGGKPSAQCMSFRSTVDIDVSKEYESYQRSVSGTRPLGDLKNRQIR
jgi:hypothetical protein